MILCNTACSASSVGAGAATNSGGPSVPRWHTPFSTLQCRAKAAAFAAEGDRFVVPAVAAAPAQEAVGQDAAFEEGVKLVFDELRQVGAGSVFGLGEGRGVLLNRSAPGRGARSEPERDPAPAGAAG